MPAGTDACPLCHAALGDPRPAAGPAGRPIPASSLADRIAALPAAPARRRSFRMPDRLDGPIWPFLWIALIPALLLPVHGGVLALVLDRACAEHVLDEGSRRLWECPSPGPTFLLPWTPGLIALGAIAWLGARRLVTRVAAVVATLVGSALVWVPLVILIPFLDGRAVEYHQVGVFDGIRAARGPEAFGTFGYTGWADIRLWTLYLWAATVGLTLLVAAFASLFAATARGARGR